MPHIASEYPDLDKYKDRYGDFYYKKGTYIYHNPYGPAYITESSTRYFIQGKLHRLDGPARIWANGDVEYYINNTFAGSSKKELYESITTLNTKNINKQDKINILDIKHYLSNGLDNDSLSLLKSLL